MNDFKWSNVAKLTTMLIVLSFAAIIVAAFVMPDTAQAPTTTTVDAQWQQIQTTEQSMLGYCAALGQASETIIDNGTGEVLGRCLPVAP